MSEFIYRDLDNFYNLKCLDLYMMGHQGFIAGGCFKNIFNNEKVKDIDIFFENETDFVKANDYFKNNDNYRYYYKNKKVISYINIKTQVRIELIKSVYGKPEDILNDFDFTIVKFAYYKEIINSEEGIEYKIIHHKDFFEHLLLKRLVVNENLKYPVSTFDRMIRYGKYGFSPCRDTKINIIKNIKSNTSENDQLSESLYDGID